MRQNQRIYAIAALLVFMGLGLSAQAVDKNTGGYPASKAAPPVSESRASALVTGPAHPTLLNAQGEILKHHSGKAKGVQPTASKGVQLQRYQMKLDRPKPSLQPSPTSPVNGLGSNWVAPLPQAGHDYLRGTYSP